MYTKEVNKVLQMEQRNHRACRTDGGMEWWLADRWWNSRVGFMKNTQSGLMAMKSARAYGMNE
jgi:hypothetical protein